MKQAKVKQPRKWQGLIGFFGHVYITDPEDSEYKMIQYQFRIIRRIDDARYAIQYFSFLDGGPTNLGVMSEEELLGEWVRLYATEELWNIGYEKEAERKRYRRQAAREAS